ncbi:MAG: hypothetical protein JWQ71_2498 [Pedosphaera sp.]|nr:hypothetical protein [Pedosphaera sp.]
MHLCIDLPANEYFTPAMRALLTLILSSALVVTGCARHKSQAAGTMVSGQPAVAGVATNPGKTEEKVILTPETMLVGKVARVNENARFAVVSFPVGSLPPTEKRLSVYRRGLKVGEIRVTGPQQGDNTVADIVNGEVQVGDELRSN